MGIFISICFQLSSNKLTARDFFVCLIICFIVFVVVVVAAVFCWVFFDSSFFVLFFPTCTSSCKVTKKKKKKGGEAGREIRRIKGKRNIKFQVSIFGWYCYHFMLCIYT